MGANLYDFLRAETDEDAAVLSLNLANDVSQLPPVSPDPNRRGSRLTEPRDELLRLLTEREPTEQSREFFLPVEDRLYAYGTTAPLLSVAFRATKSGLLLPDSVHIPHPYDDFGVFVTLNDYLPTSERYPKTILEKFMQFLCGFGTLESRLTGLIMLRNTLDDPETTSTLTHNYLDSLPEVFSNRLSSLLAHQKNRVFLSRQGVLAAIRLVLLNEPVRQHDRPSSILNTVLLVHTVSDLIYKPYHEEIDSSHRDEKSTPLRMEIFQNQLFNRFDGELQNLSRSHLLWTHYGDHISRTPISYKPQDILLQATGLDILDWISCGFGMITLSLNSDVTDVWFDIEAFPNASRERVEKFLGQVSSNLRELQTLLKVSKNRWDFHPFEESPLVRHEERFAIIDTTYLVERVTRGLYWYVHTYLKSHGSDGDLTRWTQAYGEMIENYIIDIALQLTPVSLDDTELVFDEKRQSEAYGGKVCELVIDYGSSFCTIEVVSGRVVRPTRFDGNRDTFESDTERLVLKKVRQLHSIAVKLINDETALTGEDPVEGRRIYPILVTDYPTNPLVKKYVMKKVGDEGLLQHPKICPLSIVDVGEFEQAECVLRRGRMNLPQMLQDWQYSSLSDGPLTTYLRLTKHSVHGEVTLPMSKVDIGEVSIQRLGLVPT